MRTYASKVPRIKEASGEGAQDEDKPVLEGPDPRYLARGLVAQERAQVVLFKHAEGIRQPEAEEEAPEAPEDEEPAMEAALGEVGGVVVLERHVGDGGVVAGVRLAEARLRAVQMRVLRRIVRMLLGVEGAEGVGLVAGWLLQAGWARGVVRGGGGRVVRCEGPAHDGHKHARNGGGGGQDPKEDSRADGGGGQDSTAGGGGGAAMGCWDAGMPGCWAAGLLGSAPRMSCMPAEAGRPQGSLPPVNAGAVRHVPRAV